VVSLQIKALLGRNTEALFGKIKYLAAPAKVGNASAIIMMQSKQGVQTFSIEKTHLEVWRNCFQSKLQIFTIILPSGTLLQVALCCRQI